MLAVGDRVTHDKHGLGRVISAGSGKVTVDFGSRTTLAPDADDPKLEALC